MAEYHRNPCFNNNHPHAKVAKLDIKYVIQRWYAHRTDAPVKAEDFLMNPLLVGASIKAIKHEGIAHEGRAQWSRPGDAKLRTILD